MFYAFNFCLALLASKLLYYILYMSLYSPRYLLQCWTNQGLHKCHIHCQGYLALSMIFKDSSRFVFLWCPINSILVSFLPCNDLQKLLHEGDKIAHSKHYFWQHQLSSQGDLEGFMVSVMTSGKGMRANVGLGAWSLHNRSDLDLHPFFHLRNWVLFKHCYIIRDLTLDFLNNFNPCFFCHMNG